MEAFLLLLLIVIFSIRKSQKKERKEIKQGFDWDFLIICTFIVAIFVYFISRSTIPFHVDVPHPLPWRIINIYILIHSIINMIIMKRKNQGFKKAELIFIIPFAATSIFRGAYLFVNWEAIMENRYLQIEELFYRIEGMLSD